jgi:hypothetical protein
MIITVVTDTRAIVTISLTPYESKAETSAKAAMQDRQAVGCPVYTDPADALFGGIAGNEMDALYPEDSYRN